MLSSLCWLIEYKCIYANTSKDGGHFGSVANVVGRINEVNQSRARLVLGWVTVCRRVNHLDM